MNGKEKRSSVLNEIKLLFDHSSKGVSSLKRCDITLKSQSGEGITIYNYVYNVNYFGALYLKKVLGLNIWKTTGQCLLDQRSKSNILLVAPQT